MLIKNYGILAKKHGILAKSRDSQHLTVSVISVINYYCP